MSAESTTNRFIPAAAAAQVRKNGSKGPFLWNLDIVTMRISIGTQDVPMKGQGLWAVLPGTLALEQRQFAL